MTEHIKQFAIADPRSFSGDPYEAAAKAAAQIEAVLALAAEQLPATRILLRNAEMERQMIEGDPDPLAWENGPYGKRFDAAVESLEKLRREFKLQATAGGFNPKGKN